jgi:hypothetical protein
VERKPKAEGWNEQGRDRDERDQEENKGKKKQNPPQITGYPGPSGGTQEHTAAHLPEADLRKAGELFIHSPPARASELPHSTRAPPPARQGSKGNSAEHHREGTH